MCLSISQKYTASGNLYRRVERFVSRSKSQITAGIIILTPPHNFWLVKCKRMDFQPVLSSTGSLYITADFIPKTEVAISLKDSIYFPGAP